MILDMLYVITVVIILIVGLFELAEAIGRRNND